MAALPRDTDVTLYSAAGVELNGNRNALLTVANSTTYYAEISVPDSGMFAIQWRWGSTIVATITYEATNLKSSEASTYVAAGALWDPLTSSGNPIGELAIAGGTAGTWVQQWANFGAKRMRAKIVVNTGGTAQIAGRAHYKAI